MANVISELVVRLGLDPKKFEDGQKRAAAADAKLRADLQATATMWGRVSDQIVGSSEKVAGAEEKSANRRRSSGRRLADDSRRHARDMEREGDRAGKGFFGKIKSEALGLFAVLVGANSLKDFVASQVNGLSALGRSAKIAGTSVEGLAAFGNMIEANGGKAEEAQAHFVALAQAMELYRTRGLIDAGLLQGLSIIGGQPQDDPTAIFTKFARWAQTQRDKQYVAQVGGLLGYGDAEITTAMKGQIAVLNDLAEARRRGVPTDADAAKVTALQNAFRGLSQQIVASARNLLVEFSPALTKILGLLGQDISNPRGIMAVLGILTRGILGIPVGGEVGSFFGGGVGAGGAAAPAGATAAGGVAAAAGGSGHTLADRNNNPGNLTDPRTGRFRVFATRRDGFIAMAHQLQIDYRRGQKSVRQIINDRGHGWSNEWAPGNSHASTANYIAAVSAALGISPDAALPDLTSDSATLSKLMLAMNGVERGSGYALSRTRLSAARGGLASAGGAGATTTVNIGAVNVNAPQARDAAGIAAKIGPALKSTIPAQATSGLSG